MMSSIIVSEKRPLIMQNGKKDWDNGYQSCKHQKSKDKIAAMLPDCVCADNNEEWVSITTHCLFNERSVMVSIRAPLPLVTLESTVLLLIPLQGNALGRQWIMTHVENPKEMSGFLCSKLWSHSALAVEGEVE